MCGVMPMKAKTKAQNKYIKNKYDRHNLFMIKGEKAEYQAAADTAGESLNAYIIKAIQERIKREPP
jgi:predicted HicB family RNase H-like nuclease